MSSDVVERPIVVHGTEILARDPLHVRRQKLARITLDSMVQFVGLLDAQGTVLEINKVALDAVGITLSDVEGRPFWTTFWWQVSDEINTQLRESIARAARGELVRWDTPIYGRAGGKETIIIDASLCPVLDDAGNVVFICAEGRDITEKKAQEREIAQKNLELQGLLERIRELDEIKTQFFANVSHELRTPLALILGPAQRLIDDADTLALPQRREAGQVIARNAQMLLKHVNDLLDMSRIEARKLTIELQDSDVAALLRVLASHFGVLAHDRSIDFSVDADGPCIAAVDPDKLQRVLMNLLGNAFKFVPDGGQVRCRLHDTGRELRFTVEDSGPGVKPELRQAIFERFRQGDGGSNRKASGTGLGLAIAQEFVELHKGRIEVQDSPLGGACFRVSLPRQRIGQEKVSNTPLDQTSLQGMLEELRLGRPKAPLPAAPGVSADRPRVLVVEDNPDMNRFVVQCLEREYEVATAFDGQQGLEQAQRFRPTLVLSDIMMPHVSGVEMIARLRQLPELRDTPVLLLSAKADEDLMVQLLDRGAQDYIVKPFVERELVVRVRNLVAAEQARQLSLAALAREQFAHQEVALQKQLLHSLFMQAPTLIAVLRGPNHVVELANPPISVAWGRKAENVVGRPLAEVVPELCDQGFSRLLDRVYQTGEAYLGRETPTRVEQSDGTTTTRYFNFVYSAFHAVDGVIDGVFVVASDVTDQVLAREQVSGLRDAAESANRAKDEFLAMLGHELRNPLSPIATALHLMKLRGDESNQRERTVIERQVEHLTRLVDDLLDVSRFARGRIELKRGLVDVADVVVKAIELASPLIEQRAHSLTVEVPRDCLFVEGDATRLAQVVSNLLTNAAKYTAPGGTIHVHGARHDAEIVLSVRDTGIGIAPDVLAHIFDLFVQERQALDRSQGGLGIGLSIVRSLVERHGGSVSARSAGTGHGSEFIVRLPAAIPTSQPLTPAADRASADAPQLTASQRILVVDDNEDSAAMLATVLATRGHVVRVAHDAPSALHVASGFQPEFAFLDIGLPVVDGYELAGQLRALPGLEHLRLAALTGYGQESDRLRSQQSGFQYHLVKPVDLTTIEAALRGT